MGIQFYHYDALSRQESTSKIKKGKSIYSVSGEADRIEGFHDHINNPLKPEILYGVSFSDVVKLAEEYAKNTFDSIGRKVKKGDFVMIAGVISAPIDMSSDVWEIFKKECIEWLKQKWGTNLKSIIEHKDEYFEPDHENGLKQKTLHQHIHFSCVPSIGMRFWEIHPGLIAKRKADKAYGISKKPENMCEKCFKKFKKEGRKDGDIAYKKAMSKEQDSFFTEIGDIFGLLRYGPKRVRLSREEIINRDHEKRIRQKNLIIIETKNIEALKIEKEIKEKESNLSKLNEEILTLRKREQDIITKEKRLDIRENEVEKKVKGYSSFFKHVEETQKKTIKLIQKKLLESDLGRSIFNWIWPKKVNTAEITKKEQVNKKDRQ